MIRFPHNLPELSGDDQVLNGADWIKVMATGGMRTPGTNVEDRGGVAVAFGKDIMSCPCCRFNIVTVTGT